MVGAATAAFDRSPFGDSIPYNEIRCHNTEVTSKDFDFFCGGRPLCRVVFERFDSRNIRGQIVRRQFEVELRLDVHPKCRRDSEKTRQTQRRVGGDRRSFSRDALDPGARNPARLRDRIGRKLQGKQKILPQHFAGMDRRKLFSSMMFRAEDQ